MMRNVIRSFAALAVVLAAISANAQHSIRVSVPFAFAAAGRILPAGDYRLSHSESGDLVTLSGQDLKTTLLLTAPGNRFQDERSVLRFERHGDELSLQEIAFDGTIRRLLSAKKKKPIAGQDCSDRKAIVDVPTRLFDLRSPSQQKEN